MVVNIGCPRPPWARRKYTLFGSREKFRLAINQFRKRLPSRAHQLPKRRAFATLIYGYSATITSFSNRSNDIATNKNPEWIGVNRGCQSVDVNALLPVQSQH
jgi:hypothetical protein